MEKNVHGGFVITGKDGRQIVANGKYDENGNFVKEEAASLQAQPTPEIMNDMADKGLWGSYIFMSRHEETRDLER